jgi:hypothetical protein
MHTMRRDILRFLALMLAVSSVTLGLSARLALCVGAQHSAIELIDASCCHPPPNGYTSVTAEAMPGDCPSECRDTPLGLGAALTSPSAADHAAISVPGLPSALFSRASAPLDALRQAPACMPPPALSPRQRHTTVNLC